MKKTPWFPNSIKPVRNGVYEIRGSRFESPNFRRWNGYGWSETYSAPDIHCQVRNESFYKHGEDMTGWRGIEK
jgi:hypothetical protein